MELTLQCVGSLNTLLGLENQGALSCETVRFGGGTTPTLTVLCGGPLLTVTATPRLASASPNFDFKKGISRRMQWATVTSAPTPSNAKPTQTPTTATAATATQLASDIQLASGVQLTSGISLLARKVHFSAKKSWRHISTCQNF
jgi:hypothetical protein